MNKRKIVIDLIMADTCNRQCIYCPIEFGWKIMKLENIDFLIKYLNDNIDAYDECTINFFWWEPLLNFSNIKYFLENNNNNKLKYSIWTNGMLLDDEKLNLFIKYRVEIFLTFHADTGKTYKELLLKKHLWNWLDIIQINLIVSPIDLDYAYEKIDKAIEFWFKKINIIPVMLTIRWDKASMIKLKKFINYVDEKYINNNKYNDLKIYKFSYFDWIPVELLLVFDTDLNVYMDISDELYIWKTFKKLWASLINEIENKTLIWNIKEETKLEKLIDKYDIKTIIKLVHLLPKKLWYLKDYAIVYRIMNSNKNSKSIMWWNIYDVLTKDI